MGLAAGQARLLSITARLTDNENSAQALSYSKQRLADQTEQVNTEYLAALDATKLTVLTGFNGSEANYTDISYNVMTGYNTVSCGKQYVVTDTKGRILVTDKQAQYFKEGNGDLNVFLAKFGYSQSDVDKKIATATFKNTYTDYDAQVEDDDTATTTMKSKTKPIAELPDDVTYEMTQKVDKNGNPVFVTSKLEDGSEIESPVYEFTATNLDGELHTYTIFDKHSNTDQGFYRMVRDYDWTATNAYNNIGSQTGYRVCVSNADGSWDNLEEDADPVEQQIHEAWDKYYRSINKTFCEEEHDTENPDIEFGYNTTVGYAYYIDTDYHNENLHVATFVNDAGDGTPLIDNLPIKSYTIVQKTDDNGNAVYQYPNDEISPCYTFTATDNDGNTHTYEIYNKLSDTDGNGHLLLSIDGGDSGDFTKPISTQDYGNTTAYSCVKDDYEKVFSIKTKEEEVPLNYDGTTQEQRELYDYAVAITKHHYDSTEVLQTIADDAENANYIKYLTNIFNQMTKFGYVTTTEAFHLAEKDSIKSNDWFEENLKQGKLCLKSYSASEDDFVTTTISDDEAIQEVEDERQIAIVEAKYTQDTAALEKKDERIDLELKKLDTEHSALQTEYDSIKNVIDKNVEKSFNIFS